MKRDKQLSQPSGLTKSDAAADTAVGYLAEHRMRLIMSALSARGESRARH
jgi:hypothetical protein